MPVILDLLAFYRIYRLKAVQYEARELRFWFVPKLAHNENDHYRVEGPSTFQEVEEVRYNGTTLKFNCLRATNVEEGFHQFGQDWSGSVVVWLEGVDQDSIVPGPAMVTFVVGKRTYTFIA